MTSLLKALENSQHRWFSGRMLACHAGGPGSIPGRCKVFLVDFKLKWTLKSTRVNRNVPIYDVPMNSQIGTVRGLQFTPNDVVCDPAADTLNMMSTLQESISTK